MRSSSKVFILGALFLSACTKIETSYKPASNASNSATWSRPNIILIVADDVGYELLTCNGGQSYQTKNLDAMARRGTRFTNCYGAPECSPSRFMILTGKYNFRNYEKWGYMDP